MSGNERRALYREIATVFVDGVNSQTVCAHCGGGPIEWHGEHHLDKPNARVSSLRAQGASVDRIVEEMAACTPLCRCCHMKEDGRSRGLRERARLKKGRSLVPPSPCSDCQKMTKPTRRGRCYCCYVKFMGIR